MIQDTITYSSDSLIELPDSLSQCDTTFFLDTISPIDTIAIIAKIPRGVEGQLHPSLPQTQDWTFLVLLGFYAIMVFAISKSSGQLIEILKSFFQVKDRLSLFSKTTLNDFRFKFISVLFSIGVFSLYTYVIFNPLTKPFNLETFSYFFGVTLLFFGLKYLVFNLLGYVFLDSIVSKIAKESYFNILSLLGLVLFPLLVLRIYSSCNCLYYIELAVIWLLVLGYLLVLIKLIQIFLHKIIASFYIILYLCTLEFLPLIALIMVYKLLV